MAKAKSKTSNKTGTKSKVNVRVKTCAPNTPFTKSEFIKNLAESTNLSTKEIKDILEQMSAIIEAHLGKNGPGMFTLPGLVKMVVKTRPATKARKAINPFTGEETTFKAKPASKQVKIKALSRLKSSVAA
ncbi:MAG: HU family DNA-binding protein [Gammaproteobacteria bacterium]